MRRAPVREAAVAFTLFKGKTGIDLTEAAIAHFGGLDHASGRAASVEHDPAFARRRGVRLVFGGARRGLDALHHEVEQLVGKRRPVAERERTRVLIFFREGAHVLSPPASVGMSSGLKP